MVLPPQRACLISHYPYFNILEAEIYKNLLITVPTFFDFRFQKLKDFKDFKYDFRKSVQDLATVGDPL